MLTREIDGVTYYCIRPNYCFSKLEFDIRREGNRDTPRVLLGKGQNHTIQDSRGREWHSCGLIFDPAQLRERIMSHPDWFFERMVEREHAFKRIKREIGDLRTSYMSASKVDMTALLHFFNRAVRIYTEVLPHHRLAQTVDEVLVEELREKLLHVLTDIEVEEYLSDLLISRYADNAIATGKTPFDIPKTLTFPPPPLADLVEGGIVAVTSSKDGEVYSRFLDGPASWQLHSTEFARLRLVTPYVFQLAQEPPYFALPMVSVLNHAVWEIAKILVDSGTLRRVDDILKFSASRVRELAEGSQK